MSKLTKYDVNIDEVLNNPEEIDVLCLDMDGVLADLFSVDNWVEKLDSYDTTPYKEAEPMLNMEALNKLSSELYYEHDIPTYIISWSSKGGNSYMDDVVREAKLEWLEKYFPFAVQHLYVLPYGVPKSVIVQPFKNPILFDDDPDNCKNWAWKNAIQIHNSDYVLAVLEAFRDFKRNQKENN